MWIERNMASESDKIDHGNDFILWPKRVDKSKSSDHGCKQEMTQNKKKK